MDGEPYSVAEWKDKIQPMKEASSLAEYSKGHFPPMALYHSDNNHFDLLVADTSRLVSNGLLGRAPVAQVINKQQAQTPLQEEGEWIKVPSKLPKKSSFIQKEIGGQASKVSEHTCDECGATLESKGLLDAHKYSHEETRSKDKFIYDDCDEICSSEVGLENHMKIEHDDGTWTCNDCHFQTNKSESLRKHLKKTGHQPSESSKRQTNELKECYTCKNKFEGYLALMDHRALKHPSNITCKNIPECLGWVNGKKCWFSL